MNSNSGMRKRSRRVSLTTMAAMSGSVLLAGCGGDNGAADAAAGKIATAQDKGSAKVTMIDNIFACQKQLGLSEAQCIAQYDKALTTARASAPRFEALADCEQEWGEGRCAEEKEEGQAHSGTHHRSHFSPFVTGYILGKALAPTPVYSARGGGYMTANGWRLGYAGEPGRYYSNSRAVERPRTVPKMRAASAMAKASGFGASNRTASSGFRLANRTGSVSMGG